MNEQLGMRRPEPAEPMHTDSWLRRAMEAVDMERERRVDSPADAAPMEYDRQLRGEANMVEQRIRIAEDPRLPQPPKPNFTMMPVWEVKIEKLDVGYFVTVGCQRFAVESPKSLLRLLNDYYNVERCNKVVDYIRENQNYDYPESIFNNGSNNTPAEGARGTTDPA